MECVRGWMGAGKALRPWMIEEAISGSERGWVRSDSSAWNVGFVDEMARLVGRLRM